MKVSRKEIISLGDFMDSISGKVLPIKIAYAVVKNKKLIASEKSAIEEAMQQSPEFQAYDIKRNELCYQYCLKDENGGPILDDNRYSIDPEKREEFETKLKELGAENKEIIEKEIEKEKQKNEFLNEEIDINFHTIDFDKEQIPDDILTIGEFEKLLMFEKIDTE